MEGVHLLPLVALLMCYLPPPAALAAATGDAAIAWSHDPEWYNEAQLNNNYIINIAAPSITYYYSTPATPTITARSRALISCIHTHLITFVEALFPTSHFILPASSKDPSNSPLISQASPEWFLIRDPEFFNENLALPARQQPQFKTINPHHCVFSRRLLKPYHPHGPHWVKDYSVTSKPFEWLSTTIFGLWTSAPKSD